MNESLCARELPKPDARQMVEDRPTAPPSPGGEGRGCLNPKGIASSSPGLRHRSFSAQDCRRAYDYFVLQPRRLRSPDKERAGLLPWVIMLR